MCTGFMSVIIRASDRPAVNEHGTVPSCSREVLNVSTSWATTSMRDFRLPPPCKCDLRSCGMLRTVNYRRFRTTCRSHLQGSDFLTSEDVTERLNVCND